MYILSLIQDFAQQTALTQMSVMLVVVICVTMILKFMKQPIVVGYIVSGILVGPFVFDLVNLEEQGFMELFSDIGIALLLFMVGLGLNPRVIKEHGRTALGVGIYQIIGTIVLGFVINFGLGYNLLTSLYIAIALAFSSTIVVIKLLSDKHDQDSLYGKMSIGILIVQDLVIMLSLMGVSLAGYTGGSNMTNILGGAIFLIFLVFVFSKFIIPKIMNLSAGTKEFLLLIGIGRCLFLATLFWYMGFSFEIGSLIAGISFALSPYRREIANKMSSLRDFFLVIFFITLGAHLELSALLKHRFSLFILCIFVLCIKPLLIWLMMRKYKFSNKVSFKTALSLAQVSEFSFLLIGIGVQAGHITESGILSVIMFIGIVTIVISSYMILYSDVIYKYIKKYLPREKFHERYDFWNKNKKRDVLIFGYGRLGSHIVEILEKQGLSCIVVDHDPKTEYACKQKNVTYIFGDASNDELCDELLSCSIKMVISTIRNIDDDCLIIEKAKKYKNDIIVIVVSNYINEALELYDCGADYVVMPDYISAHHTGLMLEEVGLDTDKIINKKIDHIFNIMQKDGGNQ